MDIAHNVGSSIANLVEERMKFELTPASLLHPLQILQTSFSTIVIVASLFNLAKYRFWSGEAIPGVRRPVFIRVRTAYSIAAT